MVQTIDAVYRDYNTAGVPASGDFKPRKPEIRALLKQIQNSGGQSVTRNTYASLSGVTPPTENFLGVVLDDPDPELNGYYSRVASAWVWERGFPDTFGQVTLAGSGTAQTGSVAAGVNPGDVLVYFAVVDTENTGPLTLSISGETARDVVNAAGSALSAGEWTGVVLFFLNEDGNYQLLNDAGAAAAAAASAAAADAAADRAEAAVSTTLVSTLAEFQAAIRGSSSIHLAPTLTSLTLVSADVPYLLDVLHLIRADVLTDINLPAGVFTTTTGDIAHVSDANANLRIIGAAPVETTLVSIDSISGTAGDWDVVATVADGTGFQVGAYSKWDEVGPLPHVSGDNSAPTILRGYPLPNELFKPVVGCGVLNTTAGSAVVSFPNFVTSYGVLSDFIKPTDLMHADGLTREVLSVEDTAKTVTFTDTWPRAIVSSRGYYTSQRNTGTCTTSGVLTDTVAFSNSIVTSQVNVGDILICDGQMALITEELSASSVRVSPTVNISGTKPFTIWTTGVLHEGGHEITAVSGNQITVKNRSKVKPAIKRVTTGRVIALRTILKNTGTGDGLVFGQTGGLSWIDNIAWIGSGASSSPIGILTNGRVSAGMFGNFTQHGYNSQAIFGPNTVVSRWGIGVAVGNNCSLNMRAASINGNVNLNVWVLEDGYLNLRRAVTHGAGSTGVQVNPGATVKMTEHRSWGNGGDGLRLELGANAYGEIPFYGANGGMNIRGIGNDNFHVNEGVSIRAGASGVYLSKGSGDFSRMIIACNARQCVELVDGSLEAGFDEAWITGGTGTAGNGHGIYATDGSEASAKNAAVRGNKGDGLHAISGADIKAAGARIEVNQGVSVRATKRGRVDVSDGFAAAVTVATGGQVQADAVTITTLAGVERVNEFADDYSIVRNVAGSGFGVNGLIIDGGSEMTFFKKGTLTYNFPSIAAGSYSTTTVAVTGALTTGQLAVANSNSLDSALVISARVTAADTLTIYVHNPSAGAIDPGNATLSWALWG